MPLIFAVLIPPVKPGITLIDKLEIKNLSHLQGSRNDPPKKTDD